MNRTNSIYIWCVLFALLWPVSGWSQNLDCQKHRNGQFLIRDQYGTTTVKRKGNIQIEKISGASRRSKLHVTWIDDCTYVLKPTKRTRKRTGIHIPSNAALTVKITEVNERGYVQTTTANFSNVQYIGEVTRID